MKHYTHSTKKKEDRKWKKENCYFFSHKEVLSKLYSLDVSTEGHRQYPYVIPFVPCQPTSWDPVMFPMAHCWREWVRARRKRQQAKDEWWRTETWLDVTYLLSNLKGQRWGRTRWVHCKSKTSPSHYKTPRTSQSCPTSLPVSYLTHKCGILNQCRPKKYFQ